MTRPNPAIPTTELFSQDNLLRMDETVKEVFGTMLGMEVAAFSRHPLPEETPDTHGEHTAVIGFEGAICGHCEINLSRRASAAIASAMLGGIDIDKESDAICDAIGELCNMLAGGWKDRLPNLSADCHISIPVRSCDLHPHGAGEIPLQPVSDLQMSHRTYTFGDHHMLLLTLAHARPDRRP
jgi:chemotaxis protein CheX